MHEIKDLFPLYFITMNKTNLKLLSKITIMFCTLKVGRVEILKSLCSNNLLFPGNNLMFRVKL